VKKDEELNKIDIFLVHCATGCSCCSGRDNHYRGPFETKEAAIRRAEFFMDPNANNNPVGSQYAEKGQYTIYQFEAEVVPPGSRIIVGDRVLEFFGYCEVGPSGDSGGDHFLDESDQRLWGGEIVGTLYSKPRSR
jgi:hypothetical protein